MFGTFRKHQSWMMVVVAVVTIGSFVIWNSNTNKLSNAMGVASEGNYGRLGGKPITREQINEASREVALEYYMSYGEWPHSDPSLNRNGFNAERFAYQQLFQNAKQAEMGIKVSEEAVVQRAAEVLDAGGARGGVANLNEKILKPGGLDMADFKRMIEHQIGNEQLTHLIGVAGELVTPQEAETLYRKEHRDMQAELVFFSYSNYLASVKINSNDLSAFYTNHQADYRLPERVQAAYVKFNVTNYFAAAQAALTNLDEMVTQAQLNLGTNLARGAKTKEESTNVIREELIRRRGLSDADKVARTFANELYEMRPTDPSKPVDPNILNTLAAKKGLTVQVTEPFDKETGPKDLDATIQYVFSSEAFRRTPDEPFSSTLSGRDGIYILAVQKRFPSEVPTLQSIEAKITEDYRTTEAMRAAFQAGMAFDTLATNGLAQGKSFKDLCAQQNLKPEMLPPFSLSTDSLPPEFESRIPFDTLKRVAFVVAPGKASPLARARTGAFVIFVDKLLPAEEAKMKLEMPAFLNRMRQGHQGEILNAWFMRQVTADPDFKALWEGITQPNRNKSAMKARS